MDMVLAETLRLPGWKVRLSGYLALNWHNGMVSAMEHKVLLLCNIAPSPVECRDGIDYNCEEYTDISIY